MAIMMLTLAFGLLKLQDLAERKNPKITTNIEQLEAGTKFSTDPSNFPIAFAVVAGNLQDGVRSLYDPQFVRWEATYQSLIDG